MNEEKKRLVNEFAFKSLDENIGWVRGVVTSLSAFLGVVFVFGGKLEIHIDNSAPVGCLLIAIVASIAFGFFLLFRQNQFLVEVRGMLLYEGQEKEQALSALKATQSQSLETLLWIWLLFLIGTCGLLIWVIIKIYF